MLTKDTRDNHPTATNNDVAPREVDRLPNGVRLPPLERPKKTPVAHTILAGVGRSDEHGRQDGGSVQVVRLDHRIIDALIAEGSQIGPKSACRCFYAGKPLKSQHIDAAKKANVEYVSLGWMDLDGCIRGPEDLERARGYLRTLGGYNLHTSASHDPQGLHPREDKRGGWRLRAFYIFGEQLSYDEYKRVNTFVLAGLARALGHEIKASHSKDIRRELVPLGIDPASCRAMQPAYMPRWANEDIAGQAWRECHDGPPVDVADLLVLARAEIRAEEEAAARAAEVAAARLARSCEDSGAPGAENFDARIEVHAGDVAGRVARYRAYLAKLGPARVGGGGHQLGWTACLGALGLALEVDDAWPEIEAWNAGNDPERRVSRRRLEDAYRDASTPRGWMLADVRDSRLHPGVIRIGDPQGATPPLPFEPPAGARARRINSRYLPGVKYADLPRVLYVRSDCGTGKTTMMSTAMREVAERGGLAVIMGPRTLLMDGHSQRFGVAFYRDVKTKEIRESVAVTLHSCGRVETIFEDAEGLPRMKELDLLFVDESEQCARDLFGDTILGAFRLDEVSSSANDLLRISQKVVLADAHLGEHTVAWVRDAMRWSPEQAAEQEGWLINDFHREVEVTEYTGEDERTAYDHQIDARLQDRLKNPETAAPVANYFTVKDEAKRRVEDLRAHHPGLRAYLVDADNAGDPIIAGLLRQPHKWREVADYVAFTGALGLGFDLLGDWHVFGDLKAGAGPGAKACLQGMERCRDVAKWTVHTSGRPKVEETTEAGWMAKLSRKTPQTIAILRGVSSWESYYDEDGVHRLAHDRPSMVKRFAAVRAEEARDAYLCDLTDEQGLCVKLGALRTLCTETHGYQWHRPSAEDLEVTEAQEKAHDKRAAVAAATIKEARKQGISSRPDVTDEEAEGLRKLPKTQDIVWTLEKRRIQKQYGLEDVTPDMVERDDKGRYYSKCKAFAEMELWASGEEGRGQVLTKDHAALMEGGILACRHKGVTAAIRCSLLRAFFGCDLDTAASSGAILRPLREAKLTPEIRLMIRDHLGLRGDPTTTQFAASVLRQLGLRLRSKARKEGDEVIREYVLDADALARVREDAGAYTARLQGREVRPRADTIRELRRIGIDPEAWDAMLEILEGEAA